MISLFVFSAQMSGVPTLKHLCMSLIAERHVYFRIERLPRHLVVEFLASYCKNTIFASVLAEDLFPRDPFLQRLCTEASSSRSPRTTKIMAKPTPLSARSLHHQHLKTLMIKAFTERMTVAGHKPVTVCSNGEELCYVYAPFGASKVSSVVLQLPDKQMIFHTAGIEALMINWRIAPYKVSKFQLWSEGLNMFVCWILDPLLDGNPRYLPPVRTVLSTQRRGVLRFMGELPCKVIVTTMDAFNIVSLDDKHLYSSTDMDHGPIVKLAYHKHAPPVDTHRTVKWKEEVLNWVPIHTSRLTADRFSTRVWLQFPVKKGGFDSCVYSAE